MQAHPPAIADGHLLTRDQRLVGRAVIDAVRVAARLPVARQFDDAPELLQNRESIVLRAIVADTS